MTLEYYAFKKNTRLLSRKQP